MGELVGGYILGRSGLHWLVVGNINNGMYECWVVCASMSGLVDGCSGGLVGGLVGDVSECDFLFLLALFILKMYSMYHFGVACI